MRELRCFFVVAVRRRQVVPSRAFGSCISLFGFQLFPVSKEWSEDFAFLGFQIDRSFVPGTGSRARVQMEDFNDASIVVISRGDRGLEFSSRRSRRRRRCVFRLFRLVFLVQANPLDVTVTSGGETFRQTVRLDAGLAGCRLGQNFILIHA